MRSIKEIRSIAIRTKHAPVIAGVLSLLIIGLAFQWRYLYSIGERPLSPDEVVYSQIAHSVLEGKGFTIDAENKGPVHAIPYTHRNGPTAHAAPTHILYLAGLFALGVSEQDVVYVNALLYVLGAVILFLLAKRMVPAPVAWVAALAFLCHYTLNHYALTRRIMTEPFFVFMMLSTFAVASLSFRSRTLHGLITGLVAGFFLLARGEAVLFFPLILLLTSHTFPRIWRDRYVYVCAGMALLVVTPWVVRNYIHFDSLVLARNGAGNQLWTNNNPHADNLDSMANGWSLNREPIPAPPRPGMNEVEIDKHIAGRARQFMLENPAIWFQTALRRLLYLWQPMNMFHYYVGYPLRMATFFAAALGLFAVDWRRRTTYLLLSPIAVYTAAGGLLLGGNMGERFRAMMAPAECILIIGGVWVVGWAAHRAWASPEARTVYWKRARWAVPMVAVLSALLGWGWYKGVNGQAVYSCDFESPCAYDPIAPSYWHKQAVQLEGSDDDHYLSIKRYKMWQGIWINLDPSMYEQNGEYRIDFDARVALPARVKVRVLSYDSKQTALKDENVGTYQVQSSVYQTLAMRNIEGAQEPGQWKQCTLFFNAPYKEGRFLRIWLATAAKQGTPTAEVDDIVIRRSNLAERFLLEYFHPSETYRQRVLSFFKTLR